MSGFFALLLNFELFYVCLAPYLWTLRTFSHILLTVSMTYFSFWVINIVLCANCSVKSTGYFDTVDLE